MRKVIERRCKAQRSKRPACRGVARFRAVAEREQRLLAAGRDAGTGDPQNLFKLKVRLCSGARSLRERAVVTDIAAQVRERNEDLARVAHPAAMTGKRQRFGRAAQLPEGGMLEQERRVVPGQLAP